MAKKLKKVLGERSWKIASDCTEAYVTRRGGHIGPIKFRTSERSLSPYSVAPWAEEDTKDQPDILRALRGDFFCMPFGGNETPYKDEQHPCHGESANGKWSLVDARSEYGEHRLHLTLPTKIREGQVDKIVRLINGEHVLYQQHVVSGMKGMMTWGHHAMLKFPDIEGCGLISTSPIQFGHVFPEPTELPANQGYSMLKPGATFQDLRKVPTVFRTKTDLSRYPARKGYEDIAILVNSTDVPFGWTAVSFPDQGYIWFSLKDPSVLQSTLLWHSNGGRYYAPWNGRHTCVLGLEDITGNFHYGLEQSACSNPLSERGARTNIVMRADRQYVVNYIQGVAFTEPGFGRVASIEASPTADGITLVSEKGQTTQVSVDVNFLQAQPLI